MPTERQLGRHCHLLSSKVVNPLQTLGLAMGAGFSSGLNLYATVATLGVLQRFGVIHLPAPLAIVAHPIVLGAAIALYIIEFLADKIPFVDTVWDTIHTFIRPPAAAFIAFSAAAAAPPESQRLLVFPVRASTWPGGCQRSRCPRALLPRLPRWLLQNRATSPSTALEGRVQSGAPASLATPAIAGNMVLP